LTFNIEKCDYVSNMTVQDWACAVSVAVPDLMPKFVQNNLQIIA